MDELFHPLLVFMYWQCFGEEVCQVACSSFPHDLELSLSDAVPNPIVAHVEAFGSLELACVVGYSDCTLVIAYDLCLRLWVSHGFADEACPAAILEVFE